MSSTTTLVGLLVVGGAAAYVWLDRKKPAAAAAPIVNPSFTPEGYPLPTDPYQAQVDAQLAQIQGKVGAIATLIGGAVGQGAAGAVSGVERGVVRGAATVTPPTIEETKQAIDNSVGNGQGAGITGGTNAGSVVGGWVGGALSSFPISAASGIVSGGAAGLSEAFRLADAYNVPKFEFAKPNDIYETFLIGGVARAQDAGIVPDARNFTPPDWWPFK